MSELKEYSDGTDKIKLFTDNLASDANFIYSFDCVPMDILFGGGIYSGKIYEFYGENSHGKSTLALEVTKAFAAYWKEKAVDKYGVLWEEAESALDKTRALYMGCPVDKFLICEADTLESFKANVEATLDKSIKNKMPLIIVCDTIAALQTENEAHPKPKKGGEVNAFCFTKDTKVKCLDGKVRTMLEMKEAYENNEDIWVYSWDKELNRVSPGKVKWSGQTCRSTKVIKITLDNNETIKCTPDHKFMLRDGTYKEAKDLTSEDSLMPLYYEMGNNSGNLDKNGDYEIITSPEFIPTHKMVIRDIPFGNHRHHIDMNPLNNNPSNLMILTKSEHGRLHLIEYNERESTKLATTLRNSDPEFIKLLDKTWTKERKNRVSEWTKNSHKNGKFDYQNQNDNVTKIKILKRAKQVIDEGLPLTPESYFSKIKRIRNYTKQSVINYFDNFENLYEQAKYFNHKIIKIEDAGFEDVYDITVPGLHNFALELNGSCIFVHQSGGMMEKPRVIWAMLRDLTPKLAKSNCTLILVNQVYGGGQYEAPESPGGGGIKFYSSARIRVQRSAFNKVVLPNGQEKTVGITTRLTSVKNKLTLPNQTVEITIKGETGIDKFETTYNYLVNAKSITMSGSWKNIEFPVTVGYIDKEKKDEKGNPLYVPPDFEKASFQSLDQLREMIEFKHPQIKDWLDYLCYKYACSLSPLMKVKIIDKAWKYEEQFYGKKVTELTDKERASAAILHKITSDEK
jgi:RecA/RadA recombinase